MVRHVAARNGRAVGTGARGATLGAANNNNYDREGKTTTRLVVVLGGKRGHASSNLRLSTGDKDMCHQTYDFDGNGGHVISNL